jgi:heme-degrading monooxygenase HmoA
MLVSVLEAVVQEGRTEELVDRFRAAGADLPRAIVESFLLHDVHTETWKVVTVWESRQALDEYRVTVDTPAGITMFRSVGAEPTLSIFSVEGHAAQTLQR